jgi:hypothetical protein
MPHPMDKFYQFQPSDESGFDWRPQEDLLQFTLCCIRRANLDAVWGRESLTVQATLRGALQLVAQWRLVHIPIKLPPRGPFPLTNSFAMSVAIAMLTKSLEPGCYSKMHQQFETICKLWAAYSNMFMSSLVGSETLKTVGGEMAKMYLLQLPTNSLWFERFALGCLRRMGQDVRQDWAITLQAMHGLIDSLEEEWSIVKGWEQRRFCFPGFWWIFQGQRGVSN